MIDDDACPRNPARRRQAARSVRGIVRAEGFELDRRFAGPESIELEDHLAVIGLPGFANPVDDTDAITRPVTPFARRSTLSGPRSVSASARSCSLKRPVRRSAMRPRVRVRAGRAHAGRPGRPSAHRVARRVGGLSRARLRSLAPGWCDTPSPHRELAPGLPCRARSVGPPVSPRADRGRRRRVGRAA